MLLKIFIGYIIIGCVLYIIDLYKNRHELAVYLELYFKFRTTHIILDFIDVVFVTALTILFWPFVVF